MNASLESYASLMRPLFRKVRTLAGLNPFERRLALRAILMTAGFRLALWTLPFRVIRNWSGSLAPRPNAAISPRTIAWAIRLASRYVPRATCLTQALAAQRLLNRAGFENRLQIGVARKEEFESHAWIECDGCILIGGARQSSRYTPIFSIPSTNL